MCFKVSLGDIEFQIFHFDNTRRRISGLSTRRESPHVQALALIIAISEFDYALNSHSRKTCRGRCCTEAGFMSTTCQSPLLSRGKWDFRASFLFRSQIAGSEIKRAASPSASIDRGPLKIVEWLRFGDRKVVVS